MNLTLPGTQVRACDLETRGQEKILDSLPELLGTTTEIDRAERIRETALMCGAKLLCQVEASRNNADMSGQLAKYRHVHDAMTEHIVRLRAELCADWWIGHLTHYADDRCWKETLRDLLDIQDECQRLAPV
jgi:hypothetical protein